MICSQGHDSEKVLFRHLSMVDSLGSGWVCRLEAGRGSYSLGTLCPRGHRVEGPGVIPVVRSRIASVPLISQYSLSCLSSSRMSHFEQFENGILNICLSILDHSLNFRRDPATDVARRNDPKYVGRVLSAMVSDRKTITTSCRRRSDSALG